jgi:hypothetical protein
MVITAPILMIGDHFSAEAGLRHGPYIQQSLISLRMVAGSLNSTTMVSFSETD